MQIWESRSDEKSQILNTQVALHAFDIAEIAAQLTNDVSQEPLLAALRDRQLRVFSSTWIFGLDRDLTELQSVEVLHSCQIDRAHYLKLPKTLHVWKIWGISGQRETSPPPAPCVRACRCRRKSAMISGITGKDCQCHFRRSTQYLCLRHFFNRIISTWCWWLVVVLVDCRDRNKIMSTLPNWPNVAVITHTHTHTHTMSGSFPSWSDELFAGVMFYAVNNTTVGKFLKNSNQLPLRIFKESADLHNLRYRSPRG